MTDQELLMFLTQGGDPATLTPEERASALRLMGANRERVPAPLQEPSRAPRAPSIPGTLNPRPSPAASTLTPETIANLGLTGAQLGVGLASGPLGLPATVGINTLLGGVQGAMNAKPGEGLADAVTGGLMSGGLDALGGKLGALIPRALTHAAYATGQMRMHGKEMDDVTDAAMRLRGAAHSMQRLAPPAGDAEGLKKLRQALTARKTAFETGYPAPNSVVEDVINAGTPGNKTGRDFLGLTQAQGTKRALAASDAEFLRENADELAPFAVERGTRTIPPTSGVPYAQPTTVPNIVHPVPLDVTARMASQQGKEASKLYQQLADGSWVQASQSPAAQAAKARNVKLRNAAVDQILAQGGSAADAQRYQQLMAGLTDTYTVEQANDLLWGGLRAALLRAGGASALAGGASAVTGIGDPRTAGVAGFLGGAALSPANISRVGNFMGAASSLAPAAMRVRDLYDRTTPPPPAPVRRRVAP